MARKSNNLTKGAKRNGKICNLAMHGVAGPFFPECVAKGSRLWLGVWGLELCLHGLRRLVVSRRLSSSLVVCRRLSSFVVVVASQIRCRCGKVLQVTLHGCVTCQFAPLFHCDLHDDDMSRKKCDAFRCKGAAFCEIRRLLRSSIGISVRRIVFLGCWMWPCHWDLRFRVWHRSSVFVTSLS